MKKKLVLFGLIFIVTIFSLTGCSISKNKVQVTHLKIK